MKLIISIFLLFCLAFSAGLVLDLYELSDLKISLIDNPGEGNSEKDSSETAEDDSETDYFEFCISPPDLTHRDTAAFYSTKKLVGHHKELSDPPPELA